MGRGKEGKKLLNSNMDLDFMGGQLIMPAGMKLFDSFGKGQ